MLRNYIYLSKITKSLKTKFNLRNYPLESDVPYMAHEDLQGAPSRIPNKIT